MTYLGADNQVTLTVKCHDERCGRSARFDLKKVGTPDPAVAVIGRALNGLSIGPGTGMVMSAYVALIRAVNVGGTGKLPMSDLKELCERAGFLTVRTYLASGNAVFASHLSEARAKAALESALEAYAGKPVGVLVRTAAEMAAVVAGNPFPDASRSGTVAIFLDEPPPPMPRSGRPAGSTRRSASGGGRSTSVTAPPGWAGPD